jgi:hypothetical protein
MGTVRLPDEHRAASKASAWDHLREHCVDRQRVIRNNAGCFLEPEAESCVSTFLIWNSRAKNVVERRDSIRRHHQQRVVEIEDVAYFVLPMRSKAAQPSF